MVSQHFLRLPYDFLGLPGTSQDLLGLQFPSKILVNILVKSEEFRVVPSNSRDCIAMSRGPPGAPSLGATGGPVVARRPGRSSLPAGARASRLPGWLASWLRLGWLLLGFWLDLAWFRLAFGFWLSFTILIGFRSDLA